MYNYSSNMSRIKTCKDNVLKEVIKVKPILILLCFNIILPTVDIGTDLNLIYKLYSGTYSCTSSPKMRELYEHYEDCLSHDINPHSCQHPRTFNNLQQEFISYDQCSADSYGYCSKQDQTRKLGRAPIWIIIIYNII